MECIAGLVWIATRDQAILDARHIVSRARWYVIVRYY